MRDLRGKWAAGAMTAALALVAGPAALWAGDGDPERAGASVPTGSSLPAGSVDMQGRAIDPSDRSRDPAAAVKPGLVVVKYGAPVESAWPERLEATGAEVVSYLPQDAYLVRADSDSAPRLRALVAAGAPIEGAFRPRGEDKINPDVGSSGLLDVEVQTIGGAAGASARDALDPVKTLTPPIRFDGLLTQRVRVSRKRLEQVAADPGVVAVLPYAPIHPLDERAGAIMTDPFSPTLPGPGYLTWLATKFPGLPNLPFSIAVADTGIDNGTANTGHPDFRRLGKYYLPGRVAFDLNFSADPDANDCDGHGTAVAGLAAGYNDSAGAAVQDTAGYHYGLGTAPNAVIGNSKIFGNCGNGGNADQNQITPQSYAAGARIQSNSWGGGHDGSYTSQSQKYDAYVRDAQPAVAGNQEMAQVFANGNSGEEGPNTIGDPASGKNVISVGISENQRPFRSGCDRASSHDDFHDVAEGSSRGPTDDGRIKPDLVAPGTEVTGALAPGVTTSCTYETNYTAASGSSASAPVVSGAAALVRQFYTANGVAPSPAMIKAILINTAADLDVGGSAGGAAPNFAQGFGIPNLPNALSNSRHVRIDQSKRFDTSGESYTRTVSQAPGQPLHAVLVWTDAPGPVGSGRALVNDLDLEVDAGGTIYRGNHLTNGVSTSGGSADNLNSVERINLPAGLPAPVTITVKARDIPGDGVPNVGDATDQDFALDVTGADSLKPVVRVASATAAPASGAAIVPGGAFRVTPTVVDDGPGALEDVTSAVSTANPKVSIPADASNHGDIAEGGSAPGTPVTGTLAADYPCGTPFTYTVTPSAVGATGEAQTFTAQTGIEQTQSAASNGLPITIFNQATIFNAAPVTGNFTITDVDVRLRATDAALSHGFLAAQNFKTGIESTLAYHPNLPNATGLDVVFDDSAAQSLDDLPASTTGIVKGRFKPSGPLTGPIGHNITEAGDGASQWGLEVGHVGNSGLPNPLGSATRFELLIRGERGCTDQSVQLAPASLPTGSAGSPYAASLTPSGGVGGAPYEFELTGDLPDGVMFDSSAGAFSGTPTEAGTFPVTVKAADRDLFSTTKDYEIQVGAVVTLTPSKLPAAVVGEAYDVQMDSIGGVAPRTFSVSSGTLPDGLQLDPDGHLHGTPATAAAGTPFTIRVNDSGTGQVQRGYSIPVAANPPTLTPAFLPPAVKNETYSETINVSGGAPPYALSILGPGDPGYIPGHDLDPALSFEPGTGVINGLPGSGSALSSFTVQAVDSEGRVATHSYNLDVLPPLVIVPGTLPDGVRGQEYSVGLSISGGGGNPFTFQIQSGTPPPGISLGGPSGPSSSLLAGTPTAYGTFEFRLRGTDGLGNRTFRDMSISVSNPTLVFPAAALPTATTGIPYSAQVPPASGGDDGPYTYRVVGGALPTGISLGASTGALTGIPAEAGTFPFTVRALDGTLQSADTEYSVSALSGAVLEPPPPLPPPITSPCPPGKVLKTVKKKKHGKVKKRKRCVKPKRKKRRR